MEIPVINVDQEVRVIRGDLQNHVFLVFFHKFPAPDVHGAGCVKPCNDGVALRNIFPAADIIHHSLGRIGCRIAHYKACCQYSGILSGSGICAAVENVMRAVVDKAGKHQSAAGNHIVSLLQHNLAVIGHHNFFCHGLQVFDGQGLKGHLVIVVQVVAQLGSVGGKVKQPSLRGQLEAVAVDGDVPDKKHLTRQRHVLQQLDGISVPCCHFGCGIIPINAQIGKIEVGDLFAVGPQDLRVIDGLLCKDRGVDREQGEYHQGCQKQSYKFFHFHFLFSSS